MESDWVQNKQFIYMKGNNLVTAWGVKCLLFGSFLAYVLLLNMIILATD